jgi:hypothetical protein
MISDSFFSGDIFTVLKMQPFLFPAAGTVPDGSERNSEIKMRWRQR